jgi:hypothetical protein
MENLQRRRTDGTAADRLATDNAARAGWLERCAARILAVEPDVSRDEALEIARTMQTFERTGAMEPEAAVNFVAEEMHKSGLIRFERRGETKAAWSDSARAVLG